MMVGWSGSGQVPCLLLGWFVGLCRAVLEAEAVVSSHQCKIACNNDSDSLLMIPAPRSESKRLKLRRDRGQIGCFAPRARSQTYDRKFGQTVKALATTLPARSSSKVSQSRYWPRKGGALGSDLTANQCKQAWIGPIQLKYQHSVIPSHGRGRRFDPCIAHHPGRRSPDCGAAATLRPFFAAAPQIRRRTIAQTARF